MSRFFNHKWVTAILVALTIVTAVVGNFALDGSSVSTHAAGILYEPQVAVAKDVTSPSCYKETAKKLRDLGTDAVKRTQCPPGTVIQSIVIRLSEAVALHESYVILPSGKITPAIRSKTANEIHQLQMQKRQELQKGLVIPNDICGLYNRISAGSTVAGDYITYEIDYQRSYDCNYDVFDQAQMWGHAPVPNALDWYGWLYAGSGVRWGPPDCIFLGTNHYSRAVHQSLPPGYDFLWLLTYYGCLGVTTNVSIGPLY